MTRTKALLVVLVIVALSAAYADWQVFVLGGRIGSNQDSDTQALCALRADLASRVSTTNGFLSTHPHGIPGVPVATLRITAGNAQSTLNALRPLKCPAPKKEKSHARHVGQH